MRNAPTARTRKGGANNSPLAGELPNDIPGIALYGPPVPTHGLVRWKTRQQNTSDVRPNQSPWELQQQSENDAHLREVEDKERSRQGWLKRLRPRQRVGYMWADGGNRSAGENNASK